MTHPINGGVLMVDGVEVGRVTSGTYSFVADDPKPLRGASPHGAMFDDLSFEGTLESTVPAGQIVRAMHRAGRNKRKALRRARGGA